MITLLGVALGVDTEVLFKVRNLPWVGKIPWRRKWQPTPVFPPRESHVTMPAHLETSAVATGLEEVRVHSNPKERPRQSTRHLQEFPQRDQKQLMLIELNK